MIDIWTFLASGVCGAICWRIASYRRRGARYRPGVAVCAYLLAVGSGCYSLSVLLAMLLGKHAQGVSPFLLIVLTVLMVLVCRARGNVAAVLRVDP
ncbi:Putative 3TM holin, Phage_holin_3 [Halopseudomonas litoralis]|uniref:Putative 3TM holin, Phage_holin_3 n=1 Tax=Halopseudomonas litoralis TaxID=797277 RepID=A0A1H1QQN1_9GAMM|nr:phage holin family protein [Halopseudomonas litoralis]SDS25792.1 Putative 3TM holin, Phage_holin_3 [Halopseudomonas litoralis]